jgi:hypothetical protein
MRPARTKREAAARHDRIAFVAVLGMMAAFLGASIWLIK